MNYIIFQEQDPHIETDTKPHLTVKPLVDKPLPKKTGWTIEKEIKKELEDSATQNIEEIHTQDIDFDDDFSNGATTPTEVKKEEAPSSNTITDVAEEFLNDDFKIFSPFKKQSPKQLKPLASNWSELANENQVTASIQTDGKLPLQSNENKEKILKFYWLDAWEDRFVKPGVVYLFGKVYVNPSNKKEGCVSCCLVVKNVNRQLFLLPREYVSICFFLLFYRMLLRNIF